MLQSNNPFDMRMALTSLALGEDGTAVNARAVSSDPGSGYVVEDIYNLVFAPDLRGNES
jgi:hypothetical protein